MDTKEADKPKPVHDIWGKGTETKLGNQRMDKLLCVRLHGNGNEGRRHTFAYKVEGNYLETMESARKAIMGIEETGNRKRPLSMGSDENMFSAGDLQRKAVAGRFC